MSTPPESASQDRRPHPNLFKYYLLESLLLGPFFLIALIPRFLRFRTLRYHWDDRGITARWGALFHREISLDFERIQDIHLSSNLIERRLGLAKVQVQTASGSSKAEMTIEGLQDFAAVRDYLYERMRGADATASTVASGASARPTGASAGHIGASDAAATGEVVRALREAAAELRALRLVLAARGGERPEPGAGEDGP